MKLILATFALLTIGFASAAQTLAYSLNTLFSGEVAPAGNAPWATITLTEVDEDSVSINVASNLTGGEFYSKIGLNLKENIAPTVSLSDYSDVGNFQPPTLETGSRGGGWQSTYDIWFEFNTSNAGGGANRFNGNDSFSYTMNGVGINDFTSPAVGHIQGIAVPEGTVSLWAISGPPTGTQLPEPSGVMLGALGFAILLAKRKRRAND